MIAINVTMWEPILPLDRGERYEDPVFEALEQAGLGAEGDGGGSLCSPDGEIKQIDFDVEVTTYEAIPLITRVLEDAGAPKGSELRFERDGEQVVVPFGVTEGIAIYLDGIGRSAEVYASITAQQLVDSLIDALNPIPGGELRSSWKGPRETALYIYGTDAEEMFAKIEPVLRACPLSHNARVVVRHGNPRLRPGEIKIQDSSVR
jgi:hypothetical protein